MKSEAPMRRHRVGRRRRRQRCRAADTRGRDADEELLRATEDEKQMLTRSCLNVMPTKKSATRGLNCWHAKPTLSCCCAKQTTRSCWSVSWRVLEDEWTDETELLEGTNEELHAMNDGELTREANADDELAHGADDDMELLSCDTKLAELECTRSSHWIQGNPVEDKGWGTDGTETADEEER
jgi:hypothetical protein